MENLDRTILITIIDVVPKEYLLRLVFNNSRDLQAWNRNIKSPVLDFLAIHYFRTNLIIHSTNYTASNDTMAILYLPDLYSNLHILYRVTYMSKTDIYTTKFYDIWKVQPDVTTQISRNDTDIKYICHIGQCFNQFVIEPVHYISH